MMGLNIVFFGSPEFAAESLTTLLGSEHRVTAIVSQPDRPKGRGGSTSPTPVSILAEIHNIKLFRPEKVRDKAFIEELSQIPADIFVVAAYGQFLNNKLLNMARYGAVNVHASLLPKYRGASPAASAILNGDETTGVTIMQMERGMDTGAILHTEEIGIDINDTCGSLTIKLAKLGGKALLRYLSSNVGATCGRLQDPTAATYAPLLTKEMGLIDTTQPAIKIHNQVRALNPWPGAYIQTNGGILKIWSTEIIGDKIIFNEVQPPNGKRMPYAEYLKGHKILI